jgi:hypothetical protein
VSTRRAGLRRWELFIIQHAHIDIGYTHRQETIADYQRQFIAQAVMLALDPAQAAREPDSLFKFTCEGFWAVEQFLAHASQEEREGLLRALRSGLLELSATIAPSPAGHARHARCAAQPASP